MLRQEQQRAANAGHDHEPQLQHVAEPDVVDAAVGHDGARRHLGDDATDGALVPRAHPGGLGALVEAEVEVGEGLNLLGLVGRAGQIEGGAHDDHRRPVPLDRRQRRPARVEGEAAGGRRDIRHAHLKELGVVGAVDDLDGRYPDDVAEQVGGDRDLTARQLEGLRILGEGDAGRLVALHGPHRDAADLTHRRGHAFGGHRHHVGLLRRAGLAEGFAPRAEAAAGVLGSLARGV